MQRKNDVDTCSQSDGLNKEKQNEYENEDSKERKWGKMQWYWEKWMYNRRISQHPQPRLRLGWMMWIIRAKKNTNLLSADVGGGYTTNVCQIDWTWCHPTLLRSVDCTFSSRQVCRPYPKWVFDTIVEDFHSVAVSNLETWPCGLVLNIPLDSPFKLVRWSNMLRRSGRSTMSIILGPTPLLRDGLSFWRAQSQTNIQSMKEKWDSVGGAYVMSKEWQCC